jgi:chromosome segregation ATPase
MNIEQEINALKAQVAKLSAENEELKKAMSDANAMIAVFEESFIDLDTDLTFAHEKIAGWLCQNPALLADLAAVERIVGPLDNPTPRAPAHS